jgi:hypothetical protein
MSSQLYGNRYSYVVFEADECSLRDLCFSYLRMQAIINVRAGRILVIAAAKVAVVYFIPRKYKFWSITGLPREQDIKYMLNGKHEILVGRTWLVV